MKSRLLSFLALLLLCAASLAAPPPILPDPKLTPGAVLEVTKEDICVKGYSKKVRNVPASVKRAVYAAYGILSHEPGEYEVDHLISLELGGSNSIKNLWPQSYLTKPWNAHVKDKVENKLHWMICKGQIDIKTAQREIAEDWIAAYKKYVGPGPEEAAQKPLKEKTPKLDPAKKEVWVNLGSGLYFKPGARYYGKTKKGEFMSEADALSRGFHPAKGQ